MRPLKNSKYPNLKALEFKEFKKHINYLKRKTKILKMEDLKHINFKKNQKYSLLTFDDGYIDHYKYVVPYLKKKNIYGSFFIPVKNLVCKNILSVNKIHFILEKFYKNETKLEKILEKMLYNKKINLRLIKKRWKIKRSKRKKRNFDNIKVFFIKDLLQNLLSKNLRSKIVDNLFKLYVSNNTKKFYSKLYMNERQIRSIKNDGMHIGSHSYEHNWYEFMNYKNQKEDIKKSINILKKRKLLSNIKSFCYAYGSHNNNSLKILKKENVDFAFTTNKGFEIKIGNINKLKLKRFDTNDLKNLNFN